MKTIHPFYFLVGSQVVSIIGSKMTSLAIGIKVFTETGNSTPLLLSSFFSTLPIMLGASFAGVLVDRWPRKWILLTSDLAQAIGTILLLVSFSSEHFALWHLYVIALTQGLFGMLQRPAMEASITTLMPDSQRDRANALQQITGPMAGIVAPALTGTVYAFIGVTGVMIIDLLSLAIAIGVLTRIRIPQPETTIKTQNSFASIWDEFKFGIEFLRTRKTLLNLMLFATLINFLMAGPMNLTTPYIISLTGSETMLGGFLGLMNLGIVVGGIIVSVWGGTRPRIHGVMLGILARALCLVFLGVARTTESLSVAFFLVYLPNAIITASFTSILQVKVPPAMHGRVFSLLYQIRSLATPLSLLLTGPLVDQILTPAVDQSGWSILTPLVGNQPGSEIGLLLTISGILTSLITIGVYAHPNSRRIEANLPDYSVNDLTQQIVTAH